MKWGNCMEKTGKRKSPEVLKTEDPSDRPAGVITSVCVPLVFKDVCKLLTF